MEYQFRGGPRRYRGWLRKIGLLRRPRGAPRKSRRSPAGRRTFLPCPEFFGSFNLRLPQYRLIDKSDMQRGSRAG